MYKNITSKLDMICVYNLTVSIYPTWLTVIHLKKRLNDTCKQNITSKQTLPQTSKQSVSCALYACLQ